jgi:hypothetical protein
MPPPQQHPAYVNALSDLHMAKAMLQKPANVMVKWDERKATVEIDDAIKQVWGIARKEGQPVNEHPPVDVPTWGGRLQRALELLAQARNDVGMIEDDPDPKVRKFRNYALQHIANAEKFVHEGQEDAKALAETPAPPPPPAPPIGDKPGAHPAYLHALSDLRYARALLEKPARPDVKWDEQNSIREVDAAIKEIREAAIDDGKPMTEHPAIDAKRAHKDRLREAMTLLGQSAHDIEEREDNNWAKGLRARAIGHIRNAEHAVKEAMEDRAEDKHEEKMERKHGR